MLSWKSQNCFKNKFSALTPSCTSCHFCVLSFQIIKKWSRHYNNPLLWAYIEKRPTLKSGNFVKKKKWTFFHKIPSGKCSLYLRNVWKVLFNHSGENSRTHKVYSMKTLKGTLKWKMAIFEKLHLSKGKNTNKQTKNFVHIFCMSFIFLHNFIS